MGGKEGFANPVVNAAGVLVRAVMKSVNYAAGLTGWQITRDGDAEFNDVTVRGEIYVSDPDGSYVRIYDQNPGDGAVINVQSADIPGHTLTPAEIRGDISLIAPLLPYLFVRGPQYDGKFTSSLLLKSGDWIAGVGTLPEAILTAGSVQVSDGFANPRDIGFQDVAYGILGGVGVTTVAGAEIALTSASWNTAPGQEPSADFKPGRIYKVTLEINQFASAVATHIAFLRLRRGSATIVGTLLHEWEYEILTNAGAVTRQWYCYIKNSTSATITTALSVSVQKVAGAGNITIGGPCNMLIEDVGNTVNNPNRSIIATPL